MEFETYADVIDAYERDNMGYDTLTDYINKQNIKIKEIDMDPLGDLERIINSKAYGGGVGHLLEPTQTYHQYHDFTAPMTVGAMVDNMYNRGGRVSYAQGGSRRSKYDSTGGSLASSSKSKNISPGPGGGRDDEPKGPPKIINPPLPKDKSTELFTFDEYTGKPMTYADVAAANNFLNFVKTQGGYKMGEDTEADALYEAYRTATGKDTYMQDATVDAITNQRVSQIDDGDYKAFFDHTGTITDNPTGRMSKSLMVQTPTSFTHRFMTPSGIIENDIAQPFGAPQSLSVDPYSNNIIGSDLRAEVTQQDIDRKRQMKNLDFNTAKDIGVASPGLTEFEFEGIKSGEITEPGTYVGADGGRVGLFMGGDPLTGQALSIYESMNSYGFSDQEIANALQEQGLYTPGGSTPPETTTPNIIGSQINQGGPGDGPTRPTSEIVADFQETITNRQNKLNNPDKIATFVGDFIPQQRSVADMLASGQVDKRLTGGIPLGIGSMIAKALPDKYYDMSLADQITTQAYMGYTDPNTNIGNRDPFGLNVRSAFGNYAEKAAEIVDTLEEKLAKNGFLSPYDQSRLGHYKNVTKTTLNARADIGLINLAKKQQAEKDRIAKAASEAFYAAQGKSDPGDQSRAGASGRRPGSGGTVERRDSGPDRNVDDTGQAYDSGGREGFGYGLRDGGVASMFTRRR